MLSLLMAAAVVTAGWENICPERREFPVAKVLWRADFARRDGFAVACRDGAAGSVDITPEGIRIRKTNDVGFILVTAKPFAVSDGTKVRFSASQESESSDVNFSNGFLRYFGKEESFELDAAESDNFWEGGTQTMRAIPCTAPGMKYRKFAQCRVVGDRLTPVLVVSGRASESFWSDWLAEDVAAAQEAWKPHWQAKLSGDRSGDRMLECEFDALLATDVTHTAEIRRIDGFSRLVVDDEVVAPAVYKAKHVYEGSSRDGGDTFAGKPLDGSGVRLMVKEIRLGAVPGSRGYWTPEGFDAKGAVDEIKKAMRAAPSSLFMVAIGCTAYPEFTTREHPEERWLTKDGVPVVGDGGSCMVGYSDLGQGAARYRPWPWVSPASRLWRDAVRRCIRELVSELRCQRLDRRIVGAHLWGYHDGQMSIPYADYSRAARTEYERMLAEPGCLSTNYAFAVKQMGFRALEGFAREFKQAMGKPVIAAMWCESPLSGKANASLDLTSFVRSDAMDVLVSQPSYRERLPGFPTVSVLPMESFHLHGKMFWNEFDLRTYAALESWANSWPSMKSLGHSEDLPMWQTVYRKLVGEADARRMGYWLYDMGGGWFGAPEIAADIRTLVAESEVLARLRPSDWRPDVAVVVDEVNVLRTSDDFKKHVEDIWHYAGQASYFGSSGVPYDTYLAEDVLSDERLLEGRKMVVLAFFRSIDARRAAWLNRLAARGVTLVFLSETACAGGSAAVGFSPRTLEGTFPNLMVSTSSTVENALGGRLTESLRDHGRDISSQRRQTVEEKNGVRALARYVDGTPAVAERVDGTCRRVYVCEPAGLTPDLMNRLARESGAYVCVDRTGLQVSMNGDFLSVHCLRPGSYDLRLPFRCHVSNVRSGREEKTSGCTLSVVMTAGETCRFRLVKQKEESCK